MLPVEPFGLLPERVGTAVADVVDEHPCGVHRMPDVACGTRHESEEFGTAGEPATEVDSLHHEGSESSDPAMTGPDPRAAGQSR